ncbi:DUF3253 domain-containing protein [Acidocella sp.]|uniref:DUF3253 domain-containing protein n=1 Tax=Acidocella sp. TaxID=50710 RepID=UPI002619D65C|nr:DUF3253 domain-containing protein [Acidocella sp.]
MSQSPVEQTILAMLSAQGEQKSISFIEAAKTLAGQSADKNWRQLLTPAKQAAQRLARAGQIEILRKGKPIDPDLLHGVVRIRLKRREG